MDDGFRDAHARLAVRTRLVRGRGEMVRTERVPSVGGEAVMSEERGLRRVVQAEHGEAVIAGNEAGGEHAARHVARSSATALVMDVVGRAEVQAAVRSLLVEP